MNPGILLTEEQAHAQGLQSLTTPCATHEEWIIHGILADLRRGRIPCAAVTVTGGIEAWRSTSGFRHIAAPSVP